MSLPNDELGHMLGQKCEALIIDLIFLGRSKMNDISYTMFLNATEICSW